MINAVARRSIEQYLLDSMYFQFILLPIHAAPPPPLSVSSVLFLIPFSIFNYRLYHLRRVEIKPLQSRASAHTLTYQLDSNY